MKRFLAIAALVVLQILPFAALAQSRSVAVVSDLHVGAGRSSANEWRRTEDFRWGADFAKFLDAISAAGNKHVDLVMAGDVFEMWQSPTMKCNNDLSNPGCEFVECNEVDSDRGCSEPDAQIRISLVLDRHTEFTDNLRAFASQGDNRVFIVPGNHDAALLFPQVRAKVLERVNHPRVMVVETGYWLSEDRQVFAEHGHQADEVNKFKDWPRPFVVVDGKRYIRRPWGENMVQKFYNQYEEVYPIVDNLDNEGTGFKYAIKQAGSQAAGVALGKFLRFFLFDQTLSQFGGFLGGDPNKPPTYVLAKVREKPPVFFVDALQDDPELLAAMKAAVEAGSMSLDTNAMSNEELIAICQKKDALARAKKAVETCPGSDLGGLFASMASEAAKKRMLAAYLKRTMQGAVGAGKQIPVVYVFGHTHRAQAPAPIDVSADTGGKTVTTVNTGAFQRVVSEKQVNAIAEAKTKSTGRKVLPLDLMPEDLPPCYNYVWLAPYAAKPVPELKRWIANEDGTYTAEPGECLAR